MELLPLLVADPRDAALLPGERRRLLLSEPRMVTAVRLAVRDGGRLALVAYDPAQRREGELPEPEVERLLPVGTACSLLSATIDEGGESGFAVVRGERRVEVAGTSSGGCCDHDDPWADGTEAACHPFAAETAPGDAASWEALAERLRSLDLLPRLRAAGLEERIDRLARWLALPAWVQGEVLRTRSLRERMERLAAAGQEIAAPGSSFRATDLDQPYRDAEEHLEDLVRDFASRARAQLAAGLVEEERGEALLRGARILHRRRAAALRVRAGRARLARRLEASVAAGKLPVLERIRDEHELSTRGVDALLVAGLGGHERFGDRLRQAARLLPPEEMPLGAWIAALEAGAFPQGAGER